MKHMFIVTVNMLVWMWTICPIQLSSITYKCRSCPASSGVKHKKQGFRLSHSVPGKTQDFHRHTQSVSLETKLPVLQSVAFWQFSAPPEPTYLVKLWTCNQTVVGMSPGLGSDILCDKIMLSTCFEWKNCMLPAKNTSVLVIKSCKMVCILGRCSIIHILLKKMHSNIRTEMFPYLLFQVLFVRKSCSKTRCVCETP